MIRRAALILVGLMVGPAWLTAAQGPAAAQPFWSRQSTPDPTGECGPEVDSRRLTPPASVALEALPGGLFAVPVCVNGAGPFWFLLDTGSSHTLMTPATAEAARVAVQGRAWLQTSSTRTEAGLAPIAGLAFGPLRARAVTALVTPLDHLRAGGRVLAGLLGNDVLAQTNFMIEIDRRMLTLDPSGTMASTYARHARPFTVIAGRMTVETQVDGALRRLVVDSGASRVLLAGPVVSGAARPAVAMTTANSAVTVSVLPVSELRVGTTSVRDLEALHLPERGGRLDDGLLPLTMFTRVYVNNQAGWLAFQ